MGQNRKRRNRKREAMRTEKGRQKCREKEERKAAREGPLIVPFSVAAEYLGVSVRHVRRLVQARILNGSGRAKISCGELIRYSSRSLIVDGFLEFPAERRQKRSYLTSEKGKIQGELAVIP